MLLLQKNAESEAENDLRQIKRLQTELLAMFSRSEIPKSDWPLQQTNTEKNVKVCTIILTTYISAISRCSLEW